MKSSSFSSCFGLKWENISFFGTMTAGENETWRDGTTFIYFEQANLQSYIYFHLRMQSVGRVRTIDVRNEWCHVWEHGKQYLIPLRLESRKHQVHHQTELSQREELFFMDFLSPELPVSYLLFTFTPLHISANICTLYSTTFSQCSFFKVNNN